MPTRRAVRHSFTVLAVTAVLSGTLAGVADATPPGIPSATTAKSELAALTVKADGSQTGYSRDKFPHWIDQGNSCNTREVVLKRDGTNVVTDSGCAATSGKWFSPYDGATWTAASDVDIDHVVPLADAWRTGASSWTTAQRQAYANDLSDPQLIAVTDNVNQEKGDKSPDQWKPPLTGYWCTYAKMWVAVKYKFKLTVNSAEKSALTDMLNRC
ncbi:MULTISPECIES: HNH endonuclease family protein [unclassified Amycolatopsis]|uniref:HNH endonuclease family protein n=1 Tax=unclassified Amycolatopsis TaxID=2618356 RepID=UPI002874EA83|nr:MULTISPECIES: HNH endonuclease family protein [unclassified Amycolatopsis]MDS0134015.1 HNH endonuclease [Amycolatopsis sp. 505]MDS0144891.1 HNH endonuclease [Amycolatopsis sp. CM201R]